MATGVPKKLQKTVALDLPLPAKDQGFCLAYTGKQPANEILLTPPATTHVLWEQAPDQANQLFYGDNLPILASLLQRPTIAGQVRLIYIDPPFATNSVFQSRAQGDAYNDLLVGTHYIEFLRARLILLRELLSEDGSIYVHLDENMAFSMKIILDEIFGRNNFRNWITRKKCNPKNFTHKVYGNISDYILFYTKSASYVWNRPFDPWTEERSNKEYQYTEPSSGKRYKKVPLHAPGVRHGATGEAWRGKLPPAGKHWQYPPTTLDEMDARGEIYWSANGNPRRKIYLAASEGIPIQDIWLDFKDAHNQNINITGYPTEKNPELLRRIITTSSHPGDLILDCFAGSGTTLAVASELGRHWIGIDNSPTALSTILRRFAKGLEPMGDFVSKNLLPPSQIPTMLNDFVLATLENTAEDLESTLAQWLAWQAEIL